MVNVAASIQMHNLYPGIVLIIKLIITTTHTSIQSSFHIKYLDLSYNEFGEQSGEILGPAIGKKKTFAMQYSLY